MWFKKLLEMINWTRELGVLHSKENNYFGFAFVIFS